MQIFREKEELILAIKTLKSEGKSLGLVPTMGALHEGHLSLVSNALQDCDQVVVSIFVNPTQFDNPDDLEKYPRTLEKDMELLSEFDKKIWVFTPTAAELYGEQVISENFDFQGLEKVMEGRFRTGHFDGVGTIVKRLFEVITPDKAYFGEKDYQQLQIIRKLVKDHHIPVDVIGCPILREENGLARSSRNERLDTETRQKAAFIYQTLQEAKRLFGTKNAKYIAQWVEKQFATNSELKLEYFEIADANNLKTIHKKRKDIEYRAFIAAYAGDVRLIDNIALNN